MKIKLITATKGDGKNLPIIDSISRIKTDHQIDMCVISNNTEGLSKVYNQNIDVDADYNICIHDDVQILDIDFFDKIISCQYDVFGTCGGFGWKMINPDKPNIWTIASRDYGMSGAVEHLSPDGYFVSSYGPYPLQTLTLDGHFIGLSKHAVESGLRFDERFRFHFYDMDICFQAFKLGLKTGTTGIHLRHMSRGESVHQPEFMLAQNEFIRKWQLTK